jgi:hypothetical protein
MYHTTCSIFYKWIVNWTEKTFVFQLFMIICEYKRKWVSLRVLKSMDKWWIDQEADAGEAKNQQVVTLLFQIINYFSNWKVYHNHYMGCGLGSAFFTMQLYYLTMMSSPQKISKLLQCTISKLHTNMQEIVISPFFGATFCAVFGNLPWQIQWFFLKQSPNYSQFLFYLHQISIQVGSQKI